MIPIPKPNKLLENCSSYRPISLTSCLARLFEKCILKRVTYFSESKSIISESQAGFRPSRSTVSQTTFLSQSILNGFHKPKPPLRTILTSFDFSKAFDSVWHQGIMEALRIASFPPCFVRFIASYLTDRHARIRFNGSLSKPFTLRYGVPQGSVLGPFLFILFINSLSNVLKSLENVTFSLFADDLAIWSQSASIATASRHIQTAIDAVSKWSSDNLLFLNPAKCSCTLFTLDPRQANTKLSLTLDGKLHNYIRLSYNRC